MVFIGDVGNVRNRFCFPHINIQKGMIWILIVCILCTVHHMKATHGAENGWLCSGREYP